MIVKTVNVMIEPVMMVTNCYIIGDSETKQGAIIDPGAEAEKILSEVREMGLEIKYIINTHGHYDHIGANGKVKSALDADILVHENDADMLTDPTLNLSFKGDRDKTSDPPADKILKEGEEICLGETTLKVVHTPGHTSGSMCLLHTDNIFTGDTLFAGSAGRTDLPGGSHEALIESFSHKLKPLPDDLSVYPGHGPSSMMSVEKSENPFMLLD